MEVAKVRVDQWNGPKPMRDRQRRVVVQFGQFPDCEELAPDFTASVVGWGSQLVAASPSLDALAEHIEKRFGKVAIAVGEEWNPRSWPVADWS